MNWIIRTIVCGFATSGVVIPLIPIFFLTGCSHLKSSVYGGFGNAWNHHDSWQYGGESTTYGIVGVETNFPIKKDHNVYGRAAIEHNSDPNSRDKPGNNTAEITWHIRF